LTVAVPLIAGTLDAEIIKTNYGKENNKLLFKMESIKQK